MAKDWVDFKLVKEAVTMKMVLAHYDIALRKANQSSLRGDCPLPSHSADATENSFSVSTEKNAWACQSSSCIANRDGRKGGNVLDFVAVMESCSIRDAALKLQNWFQVEASNERPTDYVPSRERKGKPDELATERKDGGDEADTEDSHDAPIDEGGGEANQPLGFALKSVDVEHPYLAFGDS